MNRTQIHAGNNVNRPSDNCPTMDKFTLKPGCGPYTPIKTGLDHGSPGLSPASVSSTWESLGDICLDAWRALNCSEAGNQRLIVQVSLPGTQICVDVRNVKAAGVLCVLGISFGIGTYVLYKIYNRFIRPSIRRKPPKADRKKRDRKHGTYEHEPCEEMGNNQSNLADVPVYYKAGFGVSLYKPVNDNNGNLRNRKGGVTHSESADSVSTEESSSSILKGNLKQTKNGYVDLCPCPGAVTGKPLIDTPDDVRKSRLNGEGEGNLSPSLTANGRAADLSLLKIDESGFVEDDNADVNVELSNSLRGNYSPTSLCEKNLRFTTESSGNPEDIIDAEHVTHLNTGIQRRGSTRSDISDSRSDVVDQPETDDEREMLSPLPLDKSPQNSPEKLCPRKLKLKLSEIAAQNTRQVNRSNNSSSCTSPDSLSLRRPESNNTDPDYSISGVSSPELDLINSETAENPIVYASTFNNIESEIHGVEDEFETISKEIQALTSKYSNTGHEPGSEILMEIFQRYPSIRVRQAEKGINFTPVDHTDSSNSRSQSGSRHNSEYGDGSVDLSWDLESFMDVVYGEGSEMTGVGKGPVGDLQGAYLSTSGLDSSINCSVELDGSLYEDELHLHLGERQASVPRDRGAKPLPKIEEYPPETDSAPCSPDYASMVVAGDTRDQLSVGPGDVLVDSGDSHEHSQEHSENSDMVSAPGSEMSAQTDRHTDDHSSSEMYSAAESRGTESRSSEMVSAGGSETGGAAQQHAGMDSEDSSSCSDPLINGCSNPCVANIGDRVEVVQYAQSEWKGETQKASLMREAYLAIPGHCECCHLRRVRGDNYCGIRSTVYQSLVHQLPPFNNWASKHSVLEQLNQAYQNKASGIRKWNFAHRISYTKDNKLEIMQRCINTLYAKMEALSRHSSYTEREHDLVTWLNSDPGCDLDLMEGTKLLMSLRAWRLYGDMEQGRDVPVFAWLLFARDSSENLSSFVRNHLNQVGNAGGLEQVEMCLLGYSLGVRIQVLRLAQHGAEDFISYYPEDGTESWPVVSLIAEDDRHYNVPVL